MLKDTLEEITDDFGKNFGEVAGKVVKGLAYSAVAIGLGLLVSSCAGNKSRRPRWRGGHYAVPATCAPTCPKFVGPEVGEHRYNNGILEKNGIAYACKLGHIDLGHVRKSADWTKFLSEKIYECLMENTDEFSFKLKEPSKYFVKLSYPENWDILPDKYKQPVARETSIKLGQYFAYTAVTWHEIITWYGYNPVGFSEFPSAFAWEDVSSNALGIYIAGKALRDERGFGFDTAMTLALDEELKKLGVQPKEVAKRAAWMRDKKWFSRGLFSLKMKKRNFDIGLDDGFVTPWTVPYVQECKGTETLSYPVPNLNFLSKWGFSMSLEIKPRERGRNKILRVVYPDKNKRRAMKNRINPAVDFPKIMEDIKKKAIEKYGVRVGVPYYFEDNKIVF